MQEKLHTGELYLPTDEELVAKQTACLELLYEFNQTRPSAEPAIFTDMDRLIVLIVLFS